MLLSLLLIVANVYVFQADNLLDNVSGGQTKNETVSVVVRKDSPYKTLEDLKFTTFAKEDSKESIVLKSIEYFETKLDHKLKTKEYADYPVLGKSLLEGEIEVMILNEAFRNIIEDDYPDFSENTRIIDSFNKETLIVRKKKESFNIVEDTFTVMISGIDVYGSISNNARSDVNILATINPQTKQIILLSIPRDYYLPFSCQQGALDKLTHTGIYGIDCTMETVGQAFDVDIDYYARVNFSSLINVVDALGGVSVNADYGFQMNQYYFSEGENYLNGSQALEFVRDRKHQVDGDLGRGRNQMKVLTAIINKMASPAIITNFSGIINSLEGSFQTNMTSKEITSLVKMQLKDMKSWDIVQMQVTGFGTYDYSFALGGDYYVMYPDQESVNIAKAAIKEMHK
ncbi:MAG TPA: LCP family protein [Erysipelotrichaceae bacterium]|nr:LCP family protein [Erysipelotrichaceae bacterium]